MTLLAPESGGDPGRAAGARADARAGHGAVSGGVEGAEQCSQGYPRTIGNRPVREYPSIFPSKAHQRWIKWMPEQRVINWLAEQ